MQGFPNNMKKNIAGLIVSSGGGIWHGVTLTIQTFFNAKTLIKIKVSMRYVLCI